MGSFISYLFKTITCNYVSLQDNASYSGDGSNCNQSNEKCFEFMENTNLTTTKNSTNVTSSDQPLQTDPTYSGNGSNFNHSKDKVLNINGDNIDAENMAKINYNQGIINIGGTHIPDEELDPSKIFNDLPAILLEVAKETLYQPDSSDDQTFSLHAGYVPLQISLLQQNNKTNTPGHSHTRREIIDSNKKTDSKNIEPEKFFKEAENFICGSDFYQKIQSEKEKKNYLHHKSKIIGVIGQAGVGKSTLIKNLFQQFVDKKQLYQAKYVIKINLRNFYDKFEISLFQFLLGENACGLNKWTKNENICTEVFKLLADEESVCILLDGLDEAKFNPEDQVDVNANNFLKQTPGNFLLALLCGQLLPKAKLIITSRPGQMLDLPSKYKPKFILTISGITQQGVKQICQNMCGGEAPNVYSHIQIQPDLKSYSLVPINCVLIVHCIYKFLHSDELESLPNNMTDVFVLSFFDFLGTNHNARRSFNKFNLGNLNHLKNISKLAWSGLCKRQFYFDDNDLKDAGLDQVDISSVTVTVKRQKLDTRLAFLQNATLNCTYFSHLLIQEFFSAIYCLFFMDSKTFKNTFFSSKQFDLQSNEFLMLTKFLFGLSNSKTLKDLNQIYSKISDRTKHIKLLKTFAKRIASTACTIKYEDDQFKSVRNVCSWLYEYQDPEVSQQISANLPKNVVLCGEIIPSDVLSFCYVIKTRTNYLSLEIFHPTFVENALWLLLNELQFIQTNSTVQIKKFKTWNTTINDEEIELLSSIIYDGIEKIEFDRCDVTPRGMKNISPRISNLTCPLQSLDLSGIKIGDSGFESVATCVHKIIQLSIGSDYDEDLTLDGVKALVEGIKASPFGLQSLNLKWSKIGDSGFESVATCVYKINQLSIRCWNDEDLTLDGVKALVEGIKASTSGVNKLELYTNSLHLIYENKKLYVGLNKFLGDYSFIDEKTAEVLCDLISDNTEEITLLACNVTRRGMKKILTRISNLTCPLQSLDLSGSKIGESGFESVATCVHKINQLSIGNEYDNDLTLDGVKALVEGIKSSPLGLQSLNLKWSKIGDSGFESVATCVHKINQLSIRCLDNEALTLDGVKALAEGIKASPFGLQSLDLSGIKIGDSGFESVATCVHKINQLSIGSKDDEDLTLDGVKALVEGIKASPLVVEKLWIKCPDDDDKMESVVRQELLGLKNKVDRVVLNYRNIV